MEYYTKEIRVGAILLGAIMIATAIAFFSSDFDKLFRGSRSYRITFDSIRAVERYAPVRYAGVTVGEVSDIRFSEEGIGGVVVLEVDIDPSVRLPKGSTAQVRTLGFLGERYIAIDPGQGGDGWIEEGGIVQGVPSYTLEEMPMIMKDLEDHMAETRYEINSFFGEDMRKSVQRSFDQAGDFLDEARQTNEELASVLEENRKDIRATMTNLRSSAENFNSLSRDLKRRPWRLIRIFPFGGGGEEPEEEKEEPAP